MPQLGIELAVNRNSVLDLLLTIVRDQLRALRFRQIDIRIVKQRSEIIFRQTGPHSLKIDQISQAIAHNNVLRLKIAMHQDSRQASEILGDLI